MKEPLAGMSAAAFSGSYVALAKFRRINTRSLAFMAEAASHPALNPGHSDHCA